MTQLCARCQRGRSYGGFFFGRPPFAPLMRAASAFAADVACPPLRPMVTKMDLRGMAANCERGIAKRLALTVGRHGAHDMGADRVVAGVAQRVVLGHLGAEVVGREAVGLLAGAFSLGEQVTQAVGIARETGAELVRRELCEVASLDVHALEINPSGLGLSSGRIAGKS